MSKIEVSVVICATRQQKLVACLDSLTKQSFKNFEVIIVDGTSNFNLTWDQQLNKTLLIKKVNNPDRFLRPARNIGIKTAKADYLIFIDDDTVAEVNFIEKSLLFAKTHSKFLIIGGQTKAIEPSYWQKFQGFLLNHPRTGVVETAVGANMLLNIKKLKIFFKQHYPERKNIFNEEVKALFADDTELCLLVNLKESGRVAFNREAIVGHLYKENYWQFLKSQFFYAQSDYWLYQQFKEELFLAEVRGWQSFLSALASNSTYWLYTRLSLKSLCRQHSYWWLPLFLLRFIFYFFGLQKARKTYNRHQQ